MKKARLLIVLGAVVSLAVVGLSQPTPAKAAAQVDGISIPDPLVMENGTPVTDVATWESQRRPELLKLFQDNVYGTTLPAPTDIKFDVNQASGGLKKVTINVTGPSGTASFLLRLFVPEGTPKGTFLLIDHRGSAGDSPSGGGYFAVGDLLANGYAAAALDASAVAPDGANYASGVIKAFYGGNPPGEAGRAISAWAWGASRAMDYLQTDPSIDPTKVAVIGHSRGGKAALWAGAQDTRFAAAISNNSGSTGAKLARSSGGEDVSAINGQFPHWFNDKYKTYNGKESSLPVDQHELMALVAPRHVAIGSATEDATANPKGEFLSYQAATPVYQLYGLGENGLANASFPPATGQKFAGPAMSYHLRTGGHGLEASDWKIYMDSGLFDGAVGATAPGTQAQAAGTTQVPSAATGTTKPGASGTAGTAGAGAASQGGATLPSAPAVQGGNSVAAPWVKSSAGSGSGSAQATTPAGGSAGAGGSLVPPWAR